MIGALGACFGRVVTMDSPQGARRRARSRWQATLWHELAHVITLQMSKQRVPRWLTEGISVYEEGKARPEWGREMEVPFAMALERKETLKLKDLNAGFTRPETIALAYYQASLLVDHIVTTYGQDALRRLLVAYGEGLEGEAALAKGLGASTDELQASFDAAVDKRFAALRSALRSPSSDGPSPPRAGDEEPRGSEGGGGGRAGQLRGAAGARPRPCRSGGCRGVRAARARRGAGAVGDRRRQSARADGRGSPRSSAICRGRCGSIARCSTTITRRSSRRAGWRCSPRRPATRRPLQLAWDRVVALDPFDAAAHTGSGRLALKRRDAAVAMREFRAALRPASPTRRRRTAIWAKPTCSPTGRRTRRRKRWPRSKSRRASSGRRTCCFGAVEGK